MDPRAWRPPCCGEMIQICGVESREGIHDAGHEGMGLPDAGDNSAKIWARKLRAPAFKRGRNGRVRTNGAAGVATGSRAGSLCPFVLVVVFIPGSGEGRQGQGPKQRQRTAPCPPRAQMGCSVPGPSSRTSTGPMRSETEAQCGPKQPVVNSETRIWQSAACSVPPDSVGSWRNRHLAP